MAGIIEVILADHKRIRPILLQLAEG